VLRLRGGCGPPDPRGPGVRLLFDQNLSHRLPRRLADLYPGSLHLRHAGLLGTDDLTIWRYAEANRLIIVSKDSDFYELAFRLGSPPKVVWLRLGSRGVSRAGARARPSERLIVTATGGVCAPGHTTANSRHSSGTPLRLCAPRSANWIPELCGRRALPSRRYRQWVAGEEAGQRRGHVARVLHL